MPRCFPPRRKRAPDLAAPAPQSLSIIVRAGHVITADRANQLAATGLQTLRADGTIARSVFQHNRGARIIRGAHGMIRLGSLVRRRLVRYRLHGSKVIAHPLPTGKRDGPVYGREGMGANCDIWSEIGSRRRDWHHLHLNYMSRRALRRVSGAGDQDGPSIVSP